jgi:predicted short-subunit dehydrogenase-like oxidoreductase (DUF2520 family)
MVSETGAETEQAEDVTARMHELAERSVEARRLRAAGLKELADLPELRDLASAKECLARLLELGVAGQLPGTVLNGSVRAIEVYLRALDGEVNRTDLAEALKLLRELKARQAATRRA